MATTAMVTFETAVDKNASPYTYVRDPTKKVVDPVMFIPVTDVIQEVDETTGKKVMKKIRYMASHNSIYVEDQEKSGVSTKYGMGMNAGERKSREDVIIIYGEALLVSSDSKPNLVEYMTKCNYNGANPNRDKGKSVLFYLKDVVAKAKAEFSKTKLLDKARGLVLSLEGNYRRMQDVAIAAHVDSNGTEDQILLALRAVAERDPDLIIGIISEDKAEIDLIVDKCLNYSLVEFTGFAYRYPNAPDKENIKGFSGKQKPEIAFKSFVTWLGTDAGQGDLATLKKLISQHEKKLAEQAA